MGWVHFSLLLRRLRTWEWWSIESLASMTTAAMANGRFVLLDPFIPPPPLCDVYYARNATPLSELNGCIICQVLDCAFACRAGRVLHEGSAAFPRIGRVEDSLGCPLPCLEALCDVIRAQLAPPLPSGMAHGLSKPMKAASTAVV